jgi:HAD superfamily hydrolase (TIGR01509 family)
MGHSSQDKHSFKALLIDLDGVLRLWPANDGRVERSFGLPNNAILKEAFKPELLQPAITGKVTDEEWRANIVEALMQKYPELDVEGAISASSGSIGAINAPVLDLVIQARKKVKIVLITNATSKLEKDLAALNIRSHLDAVVSSHIVGFAKPSPEIFKAALAAAGVTAEEAIFVDDTLSHVQAAMKLGIEGHHFTDVSKLSEYLAIIGIP